MRYSTCIFLVTLMMALASGCAQQEKRSEPVDTFVKNSKKAGATIKEGATTAVENIKDGAAAASDRISKTLKK